MGEDAAAYDRSLGRLCAGSIDALLDAVLLSSPGGTRLLDAGSGTGALALAAAGRGYRVTAVDSDPGMVEFARRLRPHPEVEYRLGALPTLDAAGAAYDVATVNFVVNHTPDPTASLRELRRVISPGGTVGATIWPRRVSALNAIWTEVIDASQVVRPSPPVLTAAQRFDRTTDGLGAVMVSAALAEVQTREFTWPFTIRPDDLWQTAVAGLALIGPVFHAQEEAARRRMEDAYGAITERLAIDGLLRLPMTAVLATGRRHR